MTTIVLNKCWTLKLWYNYPQLKTMFDNCTSLKALDKAIISQSKLYEDWLIETCCDEKLDADVTRFKGDMFELFCNGLIEFFHSIAVDYKPFDAILDSISGKDEGIDGIGINANNDKVAFQFKWLADPSDSNKDAPLTLKDAQGWCWVAHKNKWIDDTKNNNVVLITNRYESSLSLELTGRENTVSSNLKVISRKNIEKLVQDKNFWIKFIESVKAL